MKDSTKSVCVRKVVLLVAIVVLLLIYVLQVAFSHKTNVRTLYIEGDVDRVETLKASDRLYSLDKVGDEDGEVWTVDGEAAREWSARGIVNAISEVKLLGAATKSQSDDERYGLGDGSALVVRAFAGDDVVRTLYVGKLSATGSQTYVRVDEDKTVYVAQGSLRSTFEVTADDLKEPPPEEESEGEDADETAEGSGDEGADTSDDEGGEDTGGEGTPAPDEEGALD